MASKIEKVIYNPYLCYLPIIVTGLSVSYLLFWLTPNKCLSGYITQECFFKNSNYDFIYHPLNIINVVFTIYNILYLYYNVFLRQDAVGRAVKKIYSKLNKKYYIGSKIKQTTILLFCYITALFLSYFRFVITLTNSI